MLLCFWCAAALHPCAVTWKLVADPHVPCHVLSTTETGQWETHKHIHKVHLLVCVYVCVYVCMALATYIKYAHLLKRYRHMT